MVGLSIRRFTNQSKILRWCVLIILVAAGPAKAVDGAKPGAGKPKPSDVSGSNSKDGSGGSTLRVVLKGKRPPAQHQDSDEASVAKARKDPCPVSGYGGLPTEDKGDEGVWGQVAVSCSGTGWTLEYRCIAHCPPGTAVAPPPPVPPSFAEVIDTIRRHAPVPTPQFAPPVERGGGVAAVVGKRLYVNVTPASTKPRSGRYEWSGGFWYVDVLYEPGDLYFELGEDTAGACPIDSPSGRTAAGRAVNDANDCFLVVNERPAGSSAPVTVTTTWTVITTTNIPGNFAPFPVAAETVVDVPIKELQAVIVR
jgi:hypothetical protein